MLAAAVCVAFLCAFSAGAATPALAQLEARVARLESLIGQARFREAVAQAPALRSQVLALPPSKATRQLLVRTELLAGTAALALRQEGTARVYFLRALQLDPALTLAANAPPKVRRTLDGLREGP
jgi:hypothetical protein